MRKEVKQKELFEWKLFGNYYYGDLRIAKVNPDQSQESDEED